MPEYNILAKRETHYEFTIEADTEEEALEEMKRIEINENAEDYAYHWHPLVVESIKEES